MLPRDYYARLGVPRAADARRIREAYRRLARRYHPDHNPGDPEAEANFRLVAEAYEVLSDPLKRRQYDLLGPDFEARSELETADEAPSGPQTRGASSAWSTGWAARRGSMRVDADALRATARLAAVAVCLVLFIVGTRWTTGPSGSATAAPVAVDPDEQLAGRIWEATGPTEDLKMTVLGIERSVLGRAITAWKELCLPNRFYDGSEKGRKAILHNYHFDVDRYRKSLANDFDRAKSAGVFDLPIPAADREILEAMIPARKELLAWMSREDGFDCSDPTQLEQFAHWQEIFRNAGRCLQRVRKVGARRLVKWSHEGVRVCGDEPLALDG